MKKFVSANFMLELIICDGDSSFDVSYDLRDRNGQLVARGSFDEVDQALQKAIETYINQTKNANESSQS